MTGAKDGENASSIREPAERSTKEKIFDVAIDLFAQKGFAAVTMQEIAEAVGIKKASLYYHYTSKDQILEDILSYPMQMLGEIGGEQGVDDEKLIASLGLEGFLAMSQATVMKWMDAPYVEKIMRIIFVEMFHNDRIKAFFGSAILEAAAAFWVNNFTIMMKHDLIRRVDPQVVMSEYLSFFSHTWLEYFLYRYSNTTGPYSKEYSDALTQHTEFMVSCLRP
jgi:AcrR family transcriptional regulator